MSKPAPDTVIPDGGNEKPSTARPIHMSIPHDNVIRLAAGLFALALLTASCGNDTTDTRTTAEEQPGATLTPSGLAVSPAAGVGEPQEELATGQVRLWVSNQSFEDDPVAITIQVDGETIVADSFFVEGQHNWFAFDVAGLQPGVHSIVAESDTGARIEGSFTLPDGESRWLVADYWHYPEESEGPHFTFSESDRPVGFD